MGPPSGMGIPNRNASRDALIDILNVVYLVAGVVAVIVIIVAGINFATTMGDASKVTKARNMILYAVIGLVVVLVAAIITNFVIESFNTI